MSVYTAGIEAATSILGSILIDASCLSSVRDEITPEMFPLPAQAAIYTAACALQDEGQPVDPVTIGARVKETGGEWSNAYAMQLMEVTPTSANVLEYCRLLRREAMSRTLEENARRASEELTAGQDPFAVAQELTAAIEDVSKMENTSGVVTGSDAMVELFDAMNAAEDEAPYCRTGYRVLDKVLSGGLVNGRLYILAARPGNGKTTLGASIAENVSKYGKTVLFVSLEMTREELSSRRVAAHVGTVTADQVLMGDVHGSDLDKVTNAIVELSKRKIIFNRRSRINVREIQFLAQKNKADLVVIDYLGLIQHDPGRSLYERVSITSGQLKQLALTLKKPILCLAQLNREVEGRNGKPPRMSDLRDSGSIEQDANVVMLLHRLDDPDERTTILTPLDLIVAKNRHGPVTTISLGWSLNNGRIVEGGGG